ncbi:MAG: hypothetical protein VX764_10720 [Planctomycetota bacterium]|nr:hypothetical protein [Planctomycetota bacterium]
MLFTKMPVFEPGLFFSTLLVVSLLLISSVLPSSSVAYGQEVLCTDNLDNDTDGLVDCLDPDCFVDPNCGCLQESEHLLAPMGGVGPNWPASVHSVAVSEDVMVAGVIHGDGATVRSGTAVIYHRDPATGSFGPDSQQVIFASDGVIHDAFGWSVAVDQNVIVVGVRNRRPNDELEAGAAFVFRWDPAQEIWIEEQELAAPTPEEWGHFGTDVAVENNTIVIGAPDMGNSDNGMAFIYQYAPDPSLPSDPQPWKLHQDIYEHSQWDQGDQYTDQFGRSLAISGDVIVVGAYRFNTDFANITGKAFVYEKNGTDDWELSANLLPQQLAWLDYFAGSVSISGDSVVIGSSNGSLYLFERDSVTGQWPAEETQMITNGSIFSFGSEVSIDGEIVVACAPYDGTQGWQSGSALLYRKDSSLAPGQQWVEAERFCGSTVSESYRFGSSCDITGDTVVICSRGDTNPTMAFGSSWIFNGPSGGPDPILFIRGDANTDGVVDIGDPIQVLLYLFSGGILQCDDSADINDDGVVDIADPIELLTQLFIIPSNPIPAPFPDCGTDPTPDQLDCLEYPNCP